MPTHSLDTLTANAIIFSQSPRELRYLADGLIDTKQQHRKQGRGDMCDVRTCR